MAEWRRIVMTRPRVPTSRGFENPPAYVLVYTVKNIQNWIAAWISRNNNPALNQKKDPAQLLLNSITLITDEGAI